MTKKFLKFFSNNFYFCLLYMFSTLLLITTFNDLFVVNILLKISLVWGISLSFYHIYKILKRNPNKIETAIFIFLILTLLLTLIFYRNTTNLKTWIINLILMTGVFYIDKDKPKENIEKDIYIMSSLFSIFMFITFLISAILYTQRTSEMTEFEILYGKVWGLFVYKNSLAISAGIAFLLSIFCFLKSKKKAFKYFFLLNTIIQLIAVFVSKGRSAILLLLAIPFVFLFVQFKNKIFRTSIIIIPSVFCVLGFALFHEKLGGFLSGRQELWYSAWLLIKKNLFVGVGNEALVEKVYSMRPNVILPGIEMGRLHNILLQLITENGLFSLIIFLIILYLSFSKLVNKVHTLSGKNALVQKVLLSLVVGLVFVNLFESNLIYLVSFIAITFWTYLGYFLSLNEK